MAATLKDRLARQASGDADLGFDPLGTDEPRLVSILLNLIDPDPNQPRKALGDISELASSIREHGVINPIIVEIAGTGRYRIIAGERRFAACRSLGLNTMPCIVRTVLEQSRLILQLIENLQRKDLHPVEEARAFQRLMDEFNLTQRDLARRLGKSLAAVNQTLRILDLSSELLADVQTSEHANKSVLLEIAKEPDQARQLTLWQQAQTGELTVRKARAAKRSASPASQKAAKATIELAEAKVVVRFRAGEATPDRVCEALELALSLQRSQN
jgi:ParB family transcriptional regulator, chromosome partitioning protein